MDRHFMAGLKAGIPAGISLIPLGISIGLVSAQAGLNWLQAGLMTWLVMCGSAEIMALGMAMDGAPLYLILMSVFFMSLKNMIFSSSAMQRISDAPLYRRMLCSFAICDVGVGLFCTSEERSDYYLMGINIMLVLATSLSSCLGTLMTDALPASIANSFGIALYAVFFTMLVPSVSRNSRLLLLVLFTSGLNWALRFVFSSAWALVVSMVLGALIGVWYVELDGEKKEEGVLLND